MTNPINKILSTGGAALEMTQDTATELVNDLVKKGEVKREDAQVLIDQLVTKGRETRATLRETLSAQVTALSVLLKAIQHDLSTGTKESMEKARQELDTLGEQLINVRSRVGKAEVWAEESARHTLMKAQKQLATAQTYLGPVVEKIHAGAVAEAQRDIKTLGKLLNKAENALERFLRGTKY
jgi:polyhydroxyalkanoate synthesis regulator phasin